MISVASGSLPPGEQARYDIAMPTKAHAPLPEPLKYLQPFVRSLAKLHPDELNEDVDASRLDAAVRKRLRGLSEGAAMEALSQDRDLLAHWLRTSAPNDHPAHWVLGYLSLPDLIDAQIRPPAPPPRGPAMHFEAPDGFKMKIVPFRLDLKKGKLIAVISAIDQFTFDLLHRQGESWKAPPELQATRQIQPVTFGDSTGTKYVYRQVGPAPWKGVDYLLRVPGGFVSVKLSAFGADFDEAPFESKLHTVRLKAQ